MIQGQQKTGKTQLTTISLYGKFASHMKDIGFETRKSRIRKANNKKMGMQIINCAPINWIKEECVDIEDGTNNFFLVRNSIY